MGKDLVKPDTAFRTVADRCPAALAGALLCLVVFVDVSIAQPGLEQQPPGPRCEWNPTERMMPAGPLCGWSGRVGIREFLIAE